jgi:hypothetical protein
VDAITQARCKALAKDDYDRYDAEMHDYRTRLTTAQYMIEASKCARQVKQRIGSDTPNNDQQSITCQEQSIVHESNIMPTFDSERYEYNIAMARQSGRGDFSRCQVNHACIFAKILHHVIASWNY